MLSADLRKDLETVFQQVFDDSKLRVSDQVDRESLAAWDSLGHIRLVSELEEVFKVTFTIDEIESMSSVAKIVAVLEAKA